MRRLNIPGLLFLACAAALVGGCAKSDSNPSAPGSALQIWPLALGNEWNLKVFRYNVRTGGMEYVKDEIYRVYKTLLIGGVTWYEGDGSEVGFAFMTNLANGLWVQPETSSYLLLLPYPALAGQTSRFINRTETHGSDTLYCTVQSVNERVTVPAGTFSCVTYQYTNSTGDAALVYRMSPGIGIVSADFMQDLSYEGKMIVTERRELQSNLLY